ncbi:MAG: hypothetical protein AAF449_09140 [Myxococcota bacterium]
METKQERAAMQALDQALSWAGTHNVGSRPRQAMQTILTAAIPGVGPNEEEIARLGHIEIETVQEIGGRLREAGIWKGETIVYLFDRTDRHLDHKLHVSIALGSCEACITAPEARSP